MQDAVHSCTHPVRFVTAASLFDGHDAAINIMRRILQDSGAEVIHLGHNRSVREVVAAAIQEDAQGIAISSYQGGHNEYFRYMVDLLREARRAATSEVFGGGGGVIVPDEIAALTRPMASHASSRPRTAAIMGLDGMIDDDARDAATSMPTDRPSASGSGELDRALLDASSRLSLWPVSLTDSLERDGASPSDR